MYVRHKSIFEGVSNKFLLILIGSKVYNWQFLLNLCSSCRYSSVFSVVICRPVAWWRAKIVFFLYKILAQNTESRFVRCAVRYKFVNCGRYVLYEAAQFLWGLDLAFLNKISEHNFPVSVFSFNVRGVWICVHFVWVQDTLHLETDNAK